MPMPLQKMIRANAQYGKSTGSSIRPMNAAATTSMPGGGEQPRPVTVRQVARRPARRRGSPTVSGSM